ncbi:hypothetical protein RIF29_09071 [Crotalaria pallida]|uniref:Uncharacterized protein n=1 Tax=Crotalaria pallida TaxID=3830 RepID=A0AAN9IJA5_CROPI
MNCLGRNIEGINVNQHHSPLIIITPTVHLFLALFLLDPPSVYSALSLSPVSLFLAALRATRTTLSPSMTTYPRSGTSSLAYTTESSSSLTQI